MLGWARPGWRRGRAGAEGEVSSSFLWSQRRDPNSSSSPVSRAGGMACLGAVRVKCKPWSLRRTTCLPPALEA